MKRPDWGASAVSSRALIWRFWYEGRTWPTRRPPKTTLNLIITRMCTIPQGKVTTSQYKANKASSECALFPKESWSAATDFENPRKEKRETKENKAIKNEKKAKQRKNEKQRKKLKKKTKMKKWKNDEKKKRGPNGVPRDGPKNDFYMRALIRNREAIEAKKDFEHPRRRRTRRKKKGKKGEKQWKKMKETWKKTWKKLKETERSWNKMKENRVPFQNVHYSIGISGAARAAPLFSKARSKLFQNVHYSKARKVSRPSEHPRATSEGLARDLWGQVLWRREKVFIELRWREKRLDCRGH